ncbi:unnamed protein product [Gongylonema pulchrum]|uniref:Xpo1 domain-containing protein n=1 Tax=Gongylonema pulchrum TaxID=637853 RepID=A0A183D393_9BILA|nr:unnamed protein product [Gongylonema pulchrum]
MSLLQCIGQLIYEEWYDVAMPELIETCSAEIENVDLVKNTLSLALGIIGSVQKKRREFWKDNIRICLDSVEQLGHFITASVKLDGDMDKCVRNLQIIQDKLQIANSELIHSSYLDLLMHSSAPDIDDTDSAAAKRTASSSESNSDQQSLSWANILS